jgi:flagellin
VQTAEGNLNEVHAMLQRVRELAVQFKNGSLSNADRAAITAEVAELASEIERIGAQSQFNGISLLSSAASITFQVGANDTDKIDVAMIQLTGTSGVGTTYYQLATTDNTDLAAIDSAINNVSTFRGRLGAVQNRLEHSLQAAGAYQENLVAAESRIRDVDMAQEMVNYTKFSILAQAGQSMLAQANQAPQSVLQLLG